MMFPDTFEVLSVDGCIEKANGVDWTANEGEGFWAAFIKWLAAHGYGYGGACEGVPSGGETMSSKRWKELKRLEARIAELEAVMKDEELDRLLDLLQWPEKRTDAAAVRERIRGRFADAVAEALAEKDARIAKLEAMNAPKRMMECYQVAKRQGYEQAKADSADPAERVLEALEMVAREKGYGCTPLSNGRDLRVANRPGGLVYEYESRIERCYYIVVTRAEALALLAREENHDGRTKACAGPMVGNGSCLSAVPPLP